MYTFFRMLAMLTVAFLGLISPAGAQISMESDFECGNGTNFQLVDAATNTWSFEIEPDTNSTDRQWFQFRVLGAEGQTLRLRLLNTNQTNVTGHWATALPVASADGGQTWARTSGPTSTDGTTYTFEHSFTSGEELIAFHYPYTWTRAQEKIAAWAAHPDVEESVIAQSLQGRPIHLLRITDSSRPDEGKLGFWLVARQHAAEVTGSYLAEGFLDFLLSEEPQARALRRHAVINIVPMMNPDGVFLGNYRDNSQGFNLNREWDKTTVENSPSVKAVVDAIDAWVAGGGSYDFFADLHSTSGAQPHFAFHAADSVSVPLYHDPENYHEDSRRLLALIEDHSPDFAPTEGTSTSPDQSLGRQHQMFRHGVLAFTFEGGYNRINHGPRSGEWMTVEVHHGIGRALGLALRDYFNLTLTEQQSGMIAQ